MAKLTLSRTKSLNKLRPSSRVLPDQFVPGLDVLENRLVESGGPLTPNFSRTAKLPNFVIRGGHDQASFDTQTRPRTANEAMDRRKELMATGSPISVTSGRDIFNFPTPLRRPSTTQGDTHSTEARSDTPDIGIALGSPSHAAFFQSPMFESPYQNRLVVPNDILTPLSTPGRSMTSYESRSTKNDLNEGAKPKLSRWRSLGGLFGRKQAQANRERKSPLLQQTSPAPVDLKLQDYHTWERDNPSRVMFEDQTPPLSSKKTKRERMGLGRSQTAPIGRRVDSPIPPPKGPMLDVHIPETKMERYSVMFNMTPSQQNQQSGLLARRQASTSKRVDSLQVSFILLMTARLFYSQLPGSRYSRSTKTQEYHNTRAISLLQTPYIPSRVDSFTTAE
jgi:hypothetical protein